MTPEELQKLFGGANKLPEKTLASPEKTATAPEKTAASPEKTAAAPEKTASAPGREMSSIPDIPFPLQEKP